MLKTLKNSFRILRLIIEKMRRIIYDIKGILTKLLDTFLLLKLFNIYFRKNDIINEALNLNVITSPS